MLERVPVQHVHIALPCSNVGGQLHGAVIGVIGQDHRGHLLHIRHFGGADIFQISIQSVLISHGTGHIEVHLFIGRGTICRNGVNQVPHNQ